MKLSPRICKQDNFPFSDVDPLVKKLVQHAPNRLLWGSDWPHPQYFKPMPNDVALLDQMLDWVPDEKTRKMIFVDNPGGGFRLSEDLNLSQPRRELSSPSPGGGG